MDGKKIKLEEEATCEILVADTASELSAETSDVENYFEEEEEKKKKKKKGEQNNNSKPQQKSP
jgi:hypothetical protein